MTPIGIEATWWPSLGSRARISLLSFFVTQSNPFPVATELGKSQARTGKAATTRLGIDPSGGHTLWYRAAASPPQRGATVRFAGGSILETGPSPVFGTQPAPSPPAGVPARDPTATLA